MKDADNWITELFDGPVDARPGRPVPDEPVRRAPGSGAEGSVSKAGGRDRLRRLVNRAPEVMVKISGSATSMPGVRGAASYVSRNGALMMEDERGETFVGPDAVRDATAAWARSGLGIPDRAPNVEAGEKVRRETLNIVLSMPRECDRDAIKRAGRVWAVDTFGDTRPWLLAAHDDTEQPHVHVIVAVAGFDGRRLNPRKADLRRWRERFAEKLREEGIEAEATSRAIRGSTRRNVPRGRMYADPVRYPIRRQPLPPEAAVRTETTRRVVDRTYREIVAALSKGNEEDQQLARSVAAFASELGNGRERSAPIADQEVER